MTCRFSIVVPTRHRVDTLRSTLETCLDQRNFDDYEIVISDNSDDNDTRCYIEQLLFENIRARHLIRYGRPPVVCCMSDNFDHAIGQARGEYLIVLGDDDGILPLALFEIDRLIRETAAAVIRWKNGLYNWPTMAIQEAANYLGFSLTRSFTRVDGRSELAACLRNWNYERLPMLYVNSVIRADILQSVRDENGRLFHARSPDVYSAIVLAYVCGEYLDVTAPFTLAGLSGHSNGVSSAFAGSNGIPRADFETLSDRAGYRPHPHVPNLSIYPMVALADSFLYARARHFPGDGAFVLSRKELMRACVARADTDAEDVRRELLRSCEDDPKLTRFTLDLIAQKTETVPALRLKPFNLGADGANLHLNAREFGVTTVAGAVALVHQLVWPEGAPIRYDAPDLSVTLVERTRALEKALAEIVVHRRALAEQDQAHTLTLVDLDSARSTLAERGTALAAARVELEGNRKTLVERSFHLDGALAELVENRSSLVERSSHLTAALAELVLLRETLIERTEAHVSTLANLEATRCTLAERDSDLGSVLAELEGNRKTLVERSYNLEGALAELVENRSSLVERSSHLTAALAELVTLRETLGKRDEAHRSTLAELEAARSALAEQTSEFAAAQAQLGKEHHGSAKKP